jgi:maltose/moltooligosaccharide transporter
MEQTGAVQKPQQSFAGLWNISFGFFGIQVAFGLQNANVSRIFQSLGSNVDDLAFLWMAGPVTGLLVQPLIGHFSDRTWGRFGRRRPYFLAGAVLAALALIGLPNAPLLLMAAVFLWLLDASLNISMEPFRAYVGDMVNAEQRTTGYAFQTWFIGAGAVLGSLAPAIMTQLGVANVAPEGVIPPSVRYSFYIGAFAIFAAVLWTVVTTREYSPEQLQSFSQTEPVDDDSRPKFVSPNGTYWLVAGLIILGAVYYYTLEKQLYVLGGGLAVFGLAQLLNTLSKAGLGVLSQILSDLGQMPEQMRKLAVAQFFSWIALFIMWIYTTPVVTQYIYQTTDTKSQAFNDGADWVGVLFSIYNGVAALAAFLLPSMVKKWGAPRTHMLCLMTGAISYAAMFLIRDANLLILPMIGIGLTWASILTMPYVILADTLPQHKLGIYMGIFNFFIVLPQLLVAAAMGGLMNAFFKGDPIWTMLIAAIVMAIAALSTLRVKATTAN